VSVLIIYRWKWVYRRLRLRYTNVGRKAVDSFFDDTLMRYLILLTFFLTPFLSRGQTRTIIGKVIADLDLETLIQVRILSRDTLQLGTTDMNGKFRIELPSGTDQLLLNFIGMEWTSIQVPPNCDNLEIIMMYSGSYDFATVGTVNRKRSKRFKNLLNQHRQAYEKGIFSNDKPCFEYIFNKY